MIVLDTNVVSEIMKTEQDQRVARFVRASAGHMVTTVVTLFEINYGVARMPIGVRRRTTEDRFRHFLARQTPEQLRDLNRGAAEHAAAFRAQRESVGHPISVQDALIAGICAEHGATLATRNVNDFAGLGLDVVNPWEFGD